MTLGMPLPIKLSQVERYEGQPRVYFNAKSISDLAQSIEKNGQIQPIKVVKHPKDKNKYIIIDGERRFRALHLIWKKTNKEPTIDCFVSIVQDWEDHYEKSVVANLHREDLYPIDEAASIAQLRKTKSVQGIVDLLGLSVSYVYNYLKLDGLPSEVKSHLNPELPRSKQLSVTAAIMIAKATNDPTLQIELAENSIKYNLSLQDTASLIESNLNDESPERSLNINPSLQDELREKRLAAENSFTVMERKFKQFESKIKTAHSIGQQVKDSSFSEMRLHLDDYEERKNDLETRLEKLSILALSIKRML